MHEMIRLNHLGLGTISENKLKKQLVYLFTAMEDDKKESLFLVVWMRKNRRLWRERESTVLSATVTLNL